MNNERYWSLIAGEYDTLYTDRYSQLENQAVATGLNAFLAEHLPPETRFVDLGCGTGLGYELVSPEYRQWYLGIDLSASMIEQAQIKHPEAQFYHSDFMKYLTPGYALAISIFGSLSFMDNPRKVLNRIRDMAYPYEQCAFYLMFYNRLSLARRVKMQSDRLVDTYRTRHAKHALKTAAWFTTVDELRAILTEIPGTIFEIETLSSFGGILEHQALWGLDRKLSRFHLGHNIIAKGVFHA